MFAYLTHKLQAMTPQRTPTQSARKAAMAARRVQQRQLERSLSWTLRERLHCLWYRLRLNARESNDAYLRMLEWQVTGIR
jgi:hypothetical protein